MTEARYDLIKLEAHHCFMCGHAFGSGKKKRTQHHAIPSFLKPQRNVIIPICVDCHERVNKYTLQTIPNMKVFKNYLGELDKFVIEHTKKLEKYNINGGEDG